MSRVVHLIAGCLAVAAVPVSAQPDDQPAAHAGHAGMGHDQMDQHMRGTGSAPSADAGTGPANAADSIWGAEAMRESRAALLRDVGGMQTGQILVERLEARLGRNDVFLWDVQARYGGDIDKVMIKSEGEGEAGADLESGEVQLLWSHAIGPYFDLQSGIRQDLQDRGATHAAIGIQGLAPYMIHIAASAFVSHRGNLTARIEAEYDQRLTQRLILQPRVEVNLSAQDVPQTALGSGLTSLEAGLRLRFAISPQFAPYIGYGYELRTGETARLERAAGEKTEAHSFLAGIRTWF
ncbi:MAG: copper resistance protein B [Sphingomonadaceae bacterium]|nr:copper resistance protein B [Sphingomonadaceae bacterium]